MNAGSVADIRVFDTPELLAQGIADWIVERAAAGRFAICLSGGETPRRLYELLGRPPRRDRFPWDRTHWFWGDERFVPRDDPRNNFRMAWRALLGHLPIAADHIHGIPTESMTVDAAASAYEGALKDFYGAAVLDAARPLFDLTLLGLGEDGHIASLFPASPMLAERERWAVPVRGAEPPDRITLTYPVLASSRAVAFIVAGAHKRAALARLRAGDPALPASHLRPAGAVYCFADRAAAPSPALIGE